MLLLLQATVEVSGLPLSGSVQIHQLLAGHVQQLVHVHAMVDELVEGLLFLLLHFSHLGN